MMKLLKKQFCALLAVICLGAAVTGCSGSNGSGSKNKEEATTQKKVEETTTEKPTEEPTTKNPVYTHKYKGYELWIDHTYYNCESLKNATVNPGDVLYANDYALEEGQPVGNNMYAIVSALYYLYYPEKCQKFEDDYIGPHGEGIYYSDNFAFTYEGDKPMYFEFVGTTLEGSSCFDVYPLE